MTLTSADANTAARNDARQLRIGFPKGSLEAATMDLFDRAGYNVRLSSRSYVPEIDDPQLAGMLFRSQEMSPYVEDGVIDVGFCGHDWVVEYARAVHQVRELRYSPATGKPADRQGGV